MSTQDRARKVTQRIRRLLTKVDVDVRSLSDEELLAQLAVARQRQHEQDVVEDYLQRHHLDFPPGLPTGMEGVSDEEVLHLYRQATRKVYKLIESGALR